MFFPIIRAVVNILISCHILDKFKKPDPLMSAYVLDDSKPSTKYM